MKVNALHRKVLDAVTEHGLLERGDSVVAAVSGGADSMTLLGVLLALKEPLGLRRVTAVHVHHGLRGEEATRDERFVRTWCDEHGIELTVFHRDVASIAAKRGIGVEEAGRAVRYACFEEVRGGDETVKIATAHTRSDQAETVLLHLLRGSGTHGLAGIPVRRGAIIRPLLTCSRGEIEAYCRERNIPFVTDSTNADTVYRRNFVRGKVLPLLAEINPRAEEAIARAAECAAREDAYVSEQVQAVLPSVTAELGTYDTRALAALPDALLYRVLVCGAKRQGAFATAESVDTLAAWVRRGETGTLTFAGGVRAMCTPYRVGFVPIESVWQPQSLTAGATYAMGGRRYRCLVTEQEKITELTNVHKNFVICTWDCDKIKGDPILTTRRAGDALVAERSVRAKSLKDIWSERHILPLLRDSIPVVRDDDGVIAAACVGNAARVACDAQTRRVGMLVCCED